jgi:hypothetical protein
MEDYNFAQARKFWGGIDYDIKTIPPQPAQEPVGKFAKFTDGVWREVTNGSAGIPLYTTPPQRPWVGLTDGERLEAAGIDGADEWFWEVVEAIEAKLKEKNT